MAMPIDTNEQLYKQFIAAVSFLVRSYYRLQCANSHTYNIHLFWMAIIKWIFFARIANARASVNMMEMDRNVNV